MAFSEQSHIVLQEWLSQSNLTLFCENGFLRAISHCFARMVFSEQSHIVLQEWLLQSNLTLFCENGFLRAISHCFGRMAFTEQFCIEGKAWDIICDEKSILSKSYQR
jgi:trehalose-6-phosphatase